MRRGQLTTIMKKLILLLAFATVLPVTASRAQTILQAGHTDLDFNFSGGAWRVGVDHTVTTKYESGGAVLHARSGFSPGGSRFTRPASASWDFLGAGAAEPVFILLASSVPPGVIDLGLSAEETAPNTFSSYSENDDRVTASAARWITISLKSVTYFGEGAGHFSLYETPGGQPKIWMSTADGGITEQDKFLFLEGGHTHVNWGFSDVGFYEVAFEASAFLNNAERTLVKSGDVTFRFGVGVVAVPEPPTLALVGFGLLLAVAGLRRVGTVTAGPWRGGSARGRRSRGAS